MSVSSTSINNLVAELLAQIFAFLPPDERVRLERVCRQWREVAQKYAWTEFKKLTLARECNKGLAEYRALAVRCGPHLRELRFPAFWEYNGELLRVEQWAVMRNLRHLRFDEWAGVSSEMLRTIAKNLSRLQSIHFSNIDEIDIAELGSLLRVDNASLQALRLPMSVYRGGSLRLPAFPSSLRLLHITDCPPPHTKIPSHQWQQERIDELLELAASCCPQLAILMLPASLPVSEQSLAKLAQFKQIFYLRISFCPLQSFNALFADSLTRIGTQLKALLLEAVDLRVIQLVAKHCPLLEHCSFHIINYSSIHAEEGSMLSALQSLFQLAHLRSMSIGYTYGRFRAQILAAINGLKNKHNIEYLHLSLELTLKIDFITNLIRLNPKLRKLNCTIMPGYTAAEIGKLNTLLQNMDRELELELLYYCPSELKMGEKSMVQVRIRSGRLPEAISQPMLRHFWAQAMDSVPDLGNLDD